ncbi:peptide-N(4)-(N-acetyl-beta-glucosaminyl) asparagine amidase-like [Argonauta hians]
MAHGYCYEFLDDIRDNPPEVVTDTFRIILKICKNILDNPKEKKYRRLRLGNHIVEKKILPVDGAFNCLLALGFQEDDEFLTLPESDSLLDLVRIQKEIENILKSDPKLNTNSEENAPVGNETKSKPDPKPIQSPAEPKPPITTVNQNREEEIFYSSLLNYVKKVQQYEKFNLKRKARAIIPVETLEGDAKKKFKSVSDGENPDGDISFKDCLLIVLLEWFKNKFFQWVDKPLCQFCSCKDVSSIGADLPNSEESRWDAGNVELYLCPLCDTVTRFPRFNSPEKLLDTRQGRCGEWANCFTLCCRAMDFEARLVVSWTDHVWTEVFSDCQGRWLHCDPCENVCDKPLLYEAGWGVDISYIIGISRDDIQDVTRRYSTQPEKVRQNRTKVTEDWLRSALDKIRMKQKMNLSKDRKNLIDSRYDKELKEFLTVKKQPKSGELQGRTTGSLAWRLQRGETNKHTPYIFKPDAEEQKSKCLHLEYNCATDTYYRPNFSEREVHSWQTLLCSYKDIFRKEEHDWKKVYLCRTEGSQSGELTWKFDVSECGLSISRVEVLALGECFENGEILWKLTNDQNKSWPINGGHRQTVDAVEGSRTVYLTAQLRGGRGDVAWQHAQLFRQDSSSTECPLQVTLHLQ